jgi:hypothetical protein
MFNQRNENEPGTDPDMVRLARSMQPGAIEISRLPRTSEANPRRPQPAKMPGSQHLKQPTPSSLPKGPTMESPSRRRRHRGSKQPEEFELHNMNPKMPSSKSVGEPDNTSSSQQLHRSDSVPTVVTVTSDQENEIRENPYMSVDGELLSVHESSSECSGNASQPQPYSSYSNPQPRGDDVFSGSTATRKNSLPDNRYELKVPKERESRRYVPKGPRESNRGQRKQKHVSIDTETNSSTDKHSQTLRQQTTPDIRTPQSPPTTYQRTPTIPRIGIGSSSSNQSAAAAARNIPPGFESTPRKTTATTSRHPQTPTASQARQRAAEARQSDAPVTPNAATPRNSTIPSARPITPNELGTPSVNQTAKQAARNYPVMDSFMPTGNKRRRGPRL